MRRTTSLAVFWLALALCASHAYAQEAPPPDVLKVDYFTYANTKGAPDGTVRLTNPGTTGGNVCAAIFVFDPYEEMTECCSCFLSTNDLRTLSVNNDLTANPITGRTISTGSVSIVSTAAPNNDCPLPTSLSPESGGVRAWMTHINRSWMAGVPGYSGSSAPSPDATASSSELNTLTYICNFFSLTGTGQGICSCGTGD